MSKGLGQRIAIKFTADLVGDVSGKDTVTPYSFYRWYITSTWSSSGRLYLYELEFFSNGVKVDTSKIISMAGSSRYSSSYDVDRLFDGSVPGREWDANGPLPHWVSIELDEAIVIDSFRWHTGTSGNKPKEFILQGSNDGINWVDIYKDESPNLDNWIDFDVPVGNAAAFTVTGKEYQYVNGPLIDKEYKVEKVERYPVAKLWRDDFSGQMDGVEVGENGLRLEWSEDTDYSAPEGYDIALVTSDKTHRAATYIRDVLVTKGHTVTLYNTTEITASNLSGYDAIVCTRKPGDVTTDGYLRGYIDAGIPVWVGQVQGTAGDHTDSPACNLGMVGRVSLQNGRNGSYILDSGSPIVSPFNPPEQISTYSGTTWMEVAYRDDGYAGTPIANYSLGDNNITVLAIEEGTNDLFGNPYGARCGFVGWMYSLSTITLTENAQTILDRCIRWSLAARGYSESGTYTPPPITTESLPPTPRIRFDTDTPEGTSVTIEYAVSDSDTIPPGTWTVVEDGDLLTIDDAYLWLRYTLETEDTSKTPTLLTVWLEEPEAPADQIRLVMHPQGRFNNVVGPLTVQYDQTVGSLRGRGGPVEGFIETFTPTDLEPKPNPHAAENIEVSAEANIALTKVTYNRGYADEQITVSASATVDFIHVGIINP